MAPDLIRDASDWICRLQAIACTAPWGLQPIYERRESYCIVVEI